MFDHAVVVATINGKQVWIDATISNQGGSGTDLYFPPYGKALVLKAGNNSLTDIPQTKSGKIVCLEKYNIKDEISPVKFDVITTYTLNEADDTRDNLASSGLTKTEKNYLDYYSKVYSKIEAADSIKVKDDKEKNELTVIESYTIKDFFKRDSVNKKYTADFYADYISRQLPDIDGQTKTPVSVNYPYNIDYTIKVTMSNKWDIANEHDTINRKAYKFISDKIVTDNELALRYQFTYLKDYIPLDALSEFKNDVKELKDNKLSYSIYYIPDILNVPFKLNYSMLVLTLLLVCLFVYSGIIFYRQETREVSYFDSSNAFQPALGGWLILLTIGLFAAPLIILYNLINNGYYSISKWDEISTGIGSISNRALLIFEITGNVALMCITAFCLVLVLKKRDIAPRFLKLNFLFNVIFLFVGYFFSGFVKQDFSNYSMERIIETVIVAALWTYYINTSTRVKQTFVVPYPN